MVLLISSLKISVSNWKFPRE
jgi:hypothetical protein